MKVVLDKEIPALKTYSKFCNFWFEQNLIDALMRAWFGTSTEQSRNHFLLYFHKFLNTEHQYLDNSEHSISKNKCIP